MRIWALLKGGLTYIFGDYGVMYESNYLHLLVAEYMSEGIEIAGCPMVQVTKIRKEGTKG